MNDSRILIIGGPRTGKTTLGTVRAAELGVLPRSTDTLTHLGWSEASAEAARWIDADGPWVIEGVTVVRALRKWLVSNPSKPLAATVILLDKPHVSLTGGQAAMTKAVATVWCEIGTDALSRGVRVEGALTSPLLLTRPAPPPQPVAHRPVPVASGFLEAQDACAPVAVPLE